MGFDGVDITVRKGGHVEPGRVAQDLPPLVKLLRAHNLEVPHARGMRSTLVVPKSGQTDHREPWEIMREVPVHVDFVVDDLASFLREVGPVA